MCMQSHTMRILETLDPADERPRGATETPSDLLPRLEATTHHDVSQYAKNRISLQVFVRRPPVLERAPQCLAAYAKFRGNGALARKGLIAIEALSGTHQRAVIATHLRRRGPMRDIRAAKF